MSAASQRYTAVAIVLHWAIATAILLMLPLGFWMHEAAEHGEISAGVFAAFQLHKSVGLSVLALSLVRLAWRLANPPPPFPAHMPGWERLIARATHWAFYGLMLGLPLSGWLYVSAGWSVHEDEPLVLTTRFFGLFNVPALFDLNTANEAARAATAEAALTAHGLFAYAAIGLAVLHAAAALKHHLFDRDAVLAQMVPGLGAPGESARPPRNPLRLAVLGGGLGLTVIAAAAFALSVAPLIGGGATHGGEAPAATAVQPPLRADAPAGAPVWIVDQDASTIGFSFTYADEEAGELRFNGRFARWRADIRFDPESPDRSAAAVEIETDSAADGVAIHDRTLPSAEWFDAATHPRASFVTREIRQREGEAYRARGDLTLKGVTREVELPFTLRIDGGHAVMDGRARIDRTDFNVGASTGPSALISREVEIVVHVEAERAP